MIDVEQIKIVSHHVGGRAGSVALPNLAKFEKDIVQVIYDADDDCISQIEEVWSRKETKPIVLAHCLYSSDGSRNFNISFDPYMSSIYQLNEKMAGYCSDPRGLDYVLGEAGRTVRSITVSTRSLDSLVANREVPAPDFLSLDTQGSELDILQGAENALKSRIVAIQTEVSFAPLYKGAPLFVDIDRYLREKGFILAQIDQIRMSPHRVPIRMRGRSFPVQGEAMYLRSIENLIVDFADSPVAVVQLYKLAFIAAVFGYTEYALKVMGAIGTQHVDEQVKQALEKTSYVAFLRQIAGMARADQEFPPLFHEVYTQETSQARFSLSPSPRLRHLLFKNPTAFVATLASYALGYLRAYVAKLPLKICLVPRRTSFEEFLDECGLVESSDVVRERRARLEQNIAKLATRIKRS